MLSRRKPSARRRRIGRILRRVLAAGLIAVIYFEAAVRVQLGEVIRTEMRTLAQSAVNAAVSGFLTENTDIGEKLTSLTFGENGSVTALTTDPACVNYVKADISERAQRGIDALAHDEGIEVPLGSFTGVILLNRVGPPIRLDIECSQAVSCRFQSTFESAGINQTLHHIALVVDVDITVYHPFRIRSIHISTDYEIAQTVIIGSVPTYGGVVTY